MYQLLAALGLGGNFVGPILGWAVVRADEQLGKRWDSGRKCCAQGVVL